ncbi:MAG: hypothetical protein HY547_07775 [Elusimicrobia bacterium]|nr:hypothetical protein [Elusimicrobiota bacterium]
MPALEAERLLSPAAASPLSTPGQEASLIHYPQELSFLDTELTDLVDRQLEKARIRQEESSRGQWGWQTTAERRKWHMACEGRDDDGVKAFLEIKNREGVNHSFTPEEIAHWTQKYGFRPVQDPAAAAVKQIIASTESGLVFFVRELDAHHNQGLHLPSMTPFVKYWIADEFDHEIGTVYTMSIQDDLPSDFSLEQKKINLTEFKNQLGYYSGPMEALFYATCQELLTQWTYQQGIRYMTGEIPRLDPQNRLSEEEKRRPLDLFMVDYYRPIAQDEGYHHGAFLSVTRAHLWNKPDRLALLYDTLRLFKMPGAPWPNFQIRGALMAAAGIYSPVQEIDIIYNEVLVKKLDFENLPTPAGSLGALAKEKIREFYIQERPRRERLESIMKRRVLRAFQA